LAKKLVMVIILTETQVIPTRTHLAKVWVMLTKSLENFVLFAELAETFMILTVLAENFVILTELAENGMYFETCAHVPVAALRGKRRTVLGLVEPYLTWKLAQIVVR